MSTELHKVSTELHNVATYIIDSYKQFLELELEKKHDIKKTHIQIENYAHLDPSIKHEIMKTIHDGYLYTFHFQNVSTTLTIAGTNDSKILKFILFYTCFLIFLFKKTSLLTTLDITVVYFDKPKRITKGPLTALHVNSGVTSSGKYDAKVVVYRKEEIIKVLTHELIHAFNIDSKTIGKGQEDFINNYFKITCKSATLNESFTDALACYINTVMYTYFERPGNFDVQFKKNLEKERKHIIRQAEKVLVYNKYYKKDNQITTDQSICEHTHVTSYYIIKAVIYSNLDPFLKMLSETNLMINVPVYLNIVRNNLESFVNIVSLNDVSIKKKNLNMSSLNTLKLAG